MRNIAVVFLMSGINPDVQVWLRANMFVIRED
jgi:hypothetical protein